MAHTPAEWEFVRHPAAGVPGAVSVVGYRGPAQPGGVHRGMPSAHLTFVVSLDEGVRAAATESGLTAARPAAVILSGLHTSASAVDQGRAQAGVQLAIHPLAARELFGVPAAELSTSNFDADPVLGAWGRRLHEQLAESGDWPTAFARLAVRMRRRVDPHVRVRPELVQAWTELERTGGRARIQDVADRVALTPRHLGTLFRREVGLAPKTVAGLIRFSRATTVMAAQVHHHGRVDLARVAVLTGFADQSHLTREFSRHGGISPVGWLAEEFRIIQDGGHGAAGP